MVEERLFDAHRLLNEGKYAEALAALEPFVRTPVRTGAEEAVRRLTGCLMVVEGRYGEGLSLLERARTERIVPAHPPLDYRRSFVDMERPRKVAVGLLECLGIGASASELLHRLIPAAPDAAFYNVATLRSMRLLSRALAETDSDLAASVNRTFLRWVAGAVARDSARIEGLIEELDRDGDEEAVNAVRSLVVDGRRDPAG
jgi:hypothetical protein